jgi:hypothetical protein
MALKAKNGLMYHHGEESLGHISTALLSCASRLQKAFSAPPQGMSDNSGPFGCKFKVDDVSDVEKANQH